MARLAGYVSAVAEGHGSVAQQMLDAVGHSGSAFFEPGLAICGAGGSSGGAARLGPWTLLLDGRIYNPEDMPAVMNGADDDAAIILSAIEKSGLEDALAQLNGDFAIALYDQRDKSVSLARDRFGIKPLYHSQENKSTDGFAFASRPGSLLQAPEISRDVRRDYVAAIAGANYRFFDVDPTCSPYRDIGQVPAGHIVRWQEGKIIHRRYADFREEEEFDGPVEDLVDHYRSLFRDAVERRLKRAQKPAFTLSGGLDSSSVITMAHRITGLEHTAVSSTHSDATYDESGEIRDVIDAGGINWLPVQIDEPDLFDLISKMVKLHDEPVATVTWMTHFLLLENLQQQGFKSLLGGLGGDEQHAGEYDYFFYFFADLLAAGKNDLHDREIAAWVHHHDHPIHGKTADVAKAMRTVLTNPDTPGLCRPNMNLVKRYGHLVNPDYYSVDDLAFSYDRVFSSYMKSHVRNELLFNTMPCCLRAADRNMAAHGMEDFLPYLDWRLFDFMLRIPNEMKIKDGVTKWFSRQVGKGLLPEATRTRIVKTGWNAPAHRWFAEQGEAPLRDMIASQKFRERGIYQIADVESLVDDHMKIVRDDEARDNHMMALWQMSNLELWLQSLEE